MHVYLFAPIPYSFLHQRPQKITEQLRSMSVDVTYIEPSGIRDYLSGMRPGLFRRLGESISMYRRAVKSVLFTPQQPGSTESRFSGRPPSGDLTRVTLPMIIPHNRFDSAFVERLNASVYRQALARHVLNPMKRDEHTIALIENPFWGSILDAHDFTAVYYDCMDEISLYTGNSSQERFLEYEERLLRMSKGIFVTARKLHEQLHSRHPEISIRRIPNGVDAEWFEKRIRESETPAEVLGIKRPLVGYVGALYEWLDYELLADVAARLPDVSFVLVGPAGNRRQIRRLCMYPNVRWLGKKEYDQVPLYVDAFDVCIIPFRVGRISQTANPVKLYEYFAAGKPVVSTVLSELEPFTVNGLVYMASVREEFVSLVRTALGESDVTLADRRRQVAREYSWQSNVMKMYEVFTGNGGESHRT